MSKVLSLKEDSFKGSDGATVVCWKVELDDKTNPVPCYSAEAANLKIGEPLPEGWMVKVSGKGKDYLAVPKTGKGFGGQASWYNSEAGVRFTQERMDRRTALMQAVEFSTGHSTPDHIYGWSLAEEMYEWLRASDSSGAHPAESPSIGAGGGTTIDPIPATSVEGGRKEPEWLDPAVIAAPLPSTEHPVGDKPAPASPPTVLPEVSGASVGEADSATPVEGDGVQQDGGPTRAPSPTTAHVHTFIDAPREGWVLCSECGHAEKKKVARA